MITAPRQTRFMKQPHTRQPRYRSIHSATVGSPTVRASRAGSARANAAGSAIWGDETSLISLTDRRSFPCLRRGHYELATETARPLRVAAAFTELAQAI
jgi:hypothetical protein